MAGGEPLAAGRTNAVGRTIYQPSRRHIDFSVLRLAPMWLITQSSWPSGYSIPHVPTASASSFCHTTRLVGTHRRIYGSRPATQR
jgi:hypothetical protein